MGEIKPTAIPLSRHWRDSLVLRKSQTTAPVNCYFYSATCHQAGKQLYMSEPIINKVAESGLISLDLEHYYPKGETAVFDMKDHLFMGMILKEKDFREALKSLDWEKYRDKNIALTCTADAIIPVWAYMLVAAYLQPVAKEIVMGDEKELHKILFLKNLSLINTNEFADKRIVIKGCGETPIEDFVYMEITKLLRPVAKSIMYGEPCSTVPVYKKTGREK